MNRLSHSASNVFNECGAKYKYHYIDKLRSTEIFSPLIWGSAIDKGIEALLKKEDYKQKFIETWTEQVVLNKPTNLKDNALIKFLKNDYDSELLTKEDFKHIEEVTGLESEELINILETIVYNKWDNVNFTLQEQDQRLLNYVSWHCLKNKGLMLLDCVKNEILPQIEEIISTQEKIELVNSDGDAIVGYVDMVAKMKGIEGPVILDFKTSSKRYKNDSVQYSNQLALYVYALLDKYNTRKAGFIVLNKKLKDEVTHKICTLCGNDGVKRKYMTCDAIVEGKRCGGPWDIKKERKVDFQLIIDDVPKATESVVLNDFESINNLIKAGVFEKNLDSCKKYYGNMVVTCSYFNKCFKGSDEGLVKV